MSSVTRSKWYTGTAAARDLWVEGTGDGKAQEGSGTGFAPDPLER